MPDGQYGSFDFVDGYDKPRRWTGLVGQLVSFILTATFSAINIFKNIVGLQARRHGRRTLNC